MALNYVTLTLDLYDAQGNIQESGSAAFTPSSVLTDTVNHQEIGEQPVTVPFRASGAPSVSLLATDNATVLPSGWGWSVSFSGITGAPATFTFFLPFASGSAQRLSDLVSLPAGATAILAESGVALQAEG